jgi:hypothetical protein
VLETTFCPECGKPYDISLGECPVCARKRAAAEAKRTVQGKKGGRKNKKMAPKQKQSILPRREAEEDTAPLDTAAIRRAEEEARAMSGQSPAKKQPAPEPAEEEQGPDKRLIGAIIALTLVLVFIIAGVSSTLSGGSVFKHSGENTAVVSAPAEEETKEQQPQETSEAPKETQAPTQEEKVPAEEQEDEPEEEPEDEPAEEPKDLDSGDEPQPEETQPSETPSQEEQEQPADNEQPAEPEPSEEPTEETPKAEEKQEENTENTDTADTAASEIAAESESSAAV